MVIQRSETKLLKSRYGWKEYLIHFILTEHQKSLNVTKYSSVTYMCIQLWIK